MTPRSAASFVSIWSCALAAAIAHAQDAPDPAPNHPTAAQAIANRAVIAPIFRQMDTRRVAIVGIGDSNQLFSGHGWDEGFQAALSELGVPMYATGLISANHQLDNSAYQSGYGYYREGQTTIPFPVQDRFGTWLEPPASVRDLLNWETRAWQPNYAGYLPAGQRIDNLWNTAMIVTTSCPLNRQSKLQGLFWFARFNRNEDALGTGVFTAAVRRECDNVVLARSQPTRTRIGPTQGPAERIGVLRLPVPEGSIPAHSAVRLGFGVPGVGTIVGPFLGTYTQLVDVNQHSGYSYSTMFCYGGRNLRDMARCLLNTPRDTPAHFFSAVRQSQLDEGHAPRVVVVINSGLNDRSCDWPSLGLRRAPTNTPAGYADNLSVIVTQLTGAYRRAGGADGELYFLLMPSHLVADAPYKPSEVPQESPLVEFRHAAAELARSLPNAASIDFAGFMTAEETYHRVWYDRYSRAHLTIAGYTNLARRILIELRRCDADSNADGFVDFSDFADFIDCFTGACANPASADFNADGFVDAFDFFEFVDRFESGCD